MARFNIVNGPSMWKLMLSLFDGDSRERRWVRFSLEDPKIKLNVGPSVDLDVLVDGVDREGIDGESWSFEGSGSYVDLNGRIVRLSCKGFFSTQTRKGWVEF